MKQKPTSWIFDSGASFRQLQRQAQCKYLSIAVGLESFDPHVTRKENSCAIPIVVRELLISPGGNLELVLDEARTEFMGDPALPEHADEHDLEH